MDLTFGLTDQAILQVAGNAGAQVAIGDLIQTVKQQQQASPPPELPTQTGWQLAR